MDRMIYTALTGMNAAMDRQRATANNLANANTPGFRQEVFAVTPATLRDGSLEARAVARGAVRGRTWTRPRSIRPAARSTSRSMARR
ncbi:flagellar basal body protein [Erythrobacter sp. JK5]|uniref:flagellar basal body protein n=1 Tax=Erythrobacter sp. JK5 TaxID=2829500 RepID=UPI0035301044